MRTAVVWADFAAGWIGPWRRASRRGLLLLERPWHDQAVDPIRYRLPPVLVPLVEVLGRLLPRADAAVLLVGDSQEMHRRKPEIGTEEVQRQQARWRPLLSSVARRSGEIASVGVSLDTTIAGVIRTASPSPDNAPTQTWVRPLCFPSRIDMHVTSAPSVASSALSIYPPQRRTAVMGARLGSALARAGIARRALAPPLPLDVIMAKLSLRADGFAAMRSSAPNRWVVGVETSGRLGFVVKVGAKNDEGLENEARFLDHLLRSTPVIPLSWRIPELIFADVVDGWRVVVTKAIANGAPGEPPSLDEIAAIASDLVSGKAGGTPIVHGDLAPWNLRRGPDGRWVVLDWESAEFDRRPLWDVIHFVVQQGILLGVNRPGEALAQISEVAASPHLATHLDHNDVLPAIRDYLDRAPLQRHSRALGYRAELAVILA